MVSAPGKVIVYGEHAVVYGKAAIAAALSLRSYLLVTPLPKTSRTLTLNFTDINLNHTWDIDSLPWATFSKPGKKKYYFDTVERLDKELLEVVKPLVVTIPGKVQQGAASAFLYLYLMLGSKHAPASIYTLRSTIPIGAGLGSSASISVCLSTALQLQMGTLAAPFEGMLSNETQLQLKRINNWSFVGEMCIHGNPSGVDNTVATGGRAVLFKRTDYSLPPEVTHLRKQWIHFNPVHSFPELPLLLVDTRQPRRTAEQVANVRNMLNAHPEITQSMLDTIDRITAEAHDVISDPDFSSFAGSPSLARLGELIRINHGLLVSLGVSHPKLERIRELIDHTGIGWTKLTGAGGGGCSITLLKPKVKANILEELDSKLRTEGFEKYQTTLGGDGVGVLWPAVVGGSETEINQEMFLGAEGVEGVEALVGVGAIGKGIKGWRFWREWIAEGSDFCLH
ncbi:GHMP kinase [Tuber borchii]|uniref:Mevalonate kinase n=1 Tax=Tuber borchii TaxID=42251 RepID=A0A2T6ZAQ4_TUBBO|nr:GHMP kinase [Tuber borchii]